jgi:hypothetical protein
MTDEELKKLFETHEANIRQYVAEEVGGLRAEMGGVHAEMGELRGEVRQQGEEIRRDLRTEMRAQGEELRAEMRQQGDEIRRDLRAEMRAQGEELRSEMLTHREELKRHFGVVTEGLVTRIDLFGESVSLLGDRVTREIASVRADMSAGFAETHDLIRFSFNLARKKR